MTILPARKPAAKQIRAFMMQNAAQMRTGTTFSDIYIPDDRNFGNQVLSLVTSQATQNHRLALKSTSAIKIFYYYYLLLLIIIFWLNK